MTDIVAATHAEQTAQRTTPAFNKLFCVPVSGLFSRVPKLLLATQNAHKTFEFRELLGNVFELEDLTAHPKIPETPETGMTFEENAAIKAVAVSKFSSELVIADDSGLEVDVLDGAPGIYSARYSGESANHKQNIEKLLRELQQRDPQGISRTARFRCVIAMALNGSIIRTVEGVIEGIIVESARGTGGFGYDPIFQPAGYGQTFGELPADTKNQISHRARAVTALRKHLHSPK